MQNLLLRKQLFCLLALLWSFVPLHGMEQKIELKPQDLIPNSILETDKCPICLEELTPLNEPKEKNNENLFTLSCKHNIHATCLLAELIHEHPIVATSTFDRWADPQNYSCAICRAKQTVPVLPLLKKSELWWAEQTLESRLESLLDLPYTTFRQVEKDANKQVIEKFCGFDMAQQKDFLRRLWANESVPYFKALCEKNNLNPTTNEELLTATLTISECMRPGDLFFLLPEEKRFDYFTTLNSETQAKLFFDISNLPTYIWQKCLETLCKRKDRSIDGDDVLLEFLEFTWGKLNKEGAASLLEDAFSTAQPENLEKYLIKFWDELNQNNNTQTMLMVEKILESERPLKSKNNILNKLWEKFPKKMRLKYFNCAFKSAKNTQERSELLANMWEKIDSRLQNAYLMKALDGETFEQQTKSLSTLSDKISSQILKQQFIKILSTASFEQEMALFMDIGPLFDNKTCSELLAGCMLKVGPTLKRNDVKCVKKCLTVLWNKIDDPVRKTWFTFSRPLLNIFWDKYSPDEQLSLFKTLFDTNGQLSRKILKRFTREQSINFITHVLETIPDLSDSELTIKLEKLTKFQQSLYLKGLWKKRATNKNKDIFISEAPKLGKVYQPRFMKFVLKSNASLNQKVDVFAALGANFDKETCSSLGSVLMESLNSENFENCVEYFEKLSKLPTLQKKLAAKRVEKGLLREQIFFISDQKHFFNKNSKRLLFNRAFDFNGSTEKCILCEWFKKKILKEKSVADYYLSRIKTECTLTDIEKYKAFLPLQ